MDTLHVDSFKTVVNGCTFWSFSPEMHAQEKDSGQAFDPTPSATLLIWQYGSENLVGMSCGMYKGGWSDFTRGYVWISPMIERLCKKTGLDHGKYEVQEMQGHTISTRKKSHIMRQRTIAAVSNRHAFDEREVEALAQLAVRLIPS